jgi:molecular chaperone GrpE
MQFFRLGRKSPVRHHLLPERTPTTLEMEREKTRAAQLELERLRQEFDEYRRRAQRRQADAWSAGVMTACSHMVEGIDAMAQAFEVVPDELREHPWLKGMFLAAKEFAKTLRALGAVRFGLPPGADRIFDPRRYYAIDLEYRPDLPEGTILKVVRHGYLFRAGQGEQMVEQLLRPAQVIVSTREQRGEG